MLASAALVVLGASSAALVTNAPPMNSRRPIFGIGFLRAECPPVRTASGSDRINLVLRTKYHCQSNLIVIRSLPLAVLTLSLSFLNFYGEDMSRPKHVRTKNNPFHVRSESHVRFETVVVLG